MKAYFLRLLMVTCVLGFAAAPALRAEDLGAVKARMAERLSALDNFKAKGELGENNRGFVELRGGSAEAGDVMADENRDRAVVYEAIAKQVGSSAEQVGRSRARKIAADSAAGVWLQRDDGGWYQK